MKPNSNQSRKNLPKTKKEKKKSKLKTLNHKLLVYLLKKENTYFALITLALIKKFPKPKDSSLSISPFISKNHGKTKNTNFYTKTCKHKSTTNSNSSKSQLMTWWQQLRLDSNLTRRQKKRWPQLTTKTWKITRLKDGRFRNWNSTFSQPKSLRSHLKCWKTLEL